MARDLQHAYERTGECNNVKRLTVADCDVDVATLRMWKPSLQWLDASTLLSIAWPSMLLNWRARSLQRAVIVSSSFSACACCSSVVSMPTTCVRVRVCVV